MSTEAETATGADWKPGDKVRLEAPNFVIRSLEPEDLDDRALAWFADPELMTPMEASVRRTRDQVEYYLGQMDHVRDLLLGIFARDTGLLVGWFRVHGSSRNDAAWARLLIGEKIYRGRKNTLELQDAVYDFLFYSARVHKLDATIYATNTVGRRIVERAGYALDGVLRDHNIGDDGEWCDLAMYSMFEPEWRAARERRGARH